ncbi:MAG: ATP-binding protein, partial [Alphaproteobacteria bacterium]
MTRSTSMPSTRSKPQARLGARAGDASEAPTVPVLALELILASPQPMYVVAADGRVVVANAAFRAIRAPGGAPAEALTAPDMAARVLTEGRVVEQTVAAEVGDATRLYAAIHAPIFDDAGAVVAVGGHYRDFTLEARAERHAEALSDRLDDLIRLLSDWVWEVDAEFRFTSLSPRAMAALGLPPAALKSRVLFDIGSFTGERGGGPTTATRSPFRDQVFRSTALDGQGRYNRLTGVPVFDGGGRFAGFRGVGTDITAELAAESRAEDAQKRLIDAVEAISEGLALYDASDRLILGNRRFGEMFPEVAGGESGMSFEALLHASRMDAELAEHEREARIAERLSRHREPLGAIEQPISGGRWVLINEQRTRDGGIVSVYTDITELKRREAALAGAEAMERAARQAAEAANRAKSSFLANVSHELRTPLNAVIGFSEIMMGETYGPLGVPRYVEYVRDIHESGRHLLNLINDLLDFSKAEAGKLSLRDGDVTVTAVVTRARRFTDAMARQGGVALVEDIPADLPRLRADERRIAQMLTNLLSNAIKFTPEGGSVTIRARHEADGGLSLAIEDTGAGMRAEDIPGVLEPFVQLEDSLTRRHQGTGLGLPFTRSLIELHGGRLDLASEPG